MPAIMGGSAMNIVEKLIVIQETLKAPKSQRNNFGNYNYRSCEDILEAVKPILREQKCAIIITDELVNIGNRFHIKATATLLDSESENKLESSAFAREEETKKGMDGSQITGASSSYARKYALNGLFCIDDTKDSDGTNDHGKAPEQPKPICPKCGKESKCVKAKGRNISGAEFLEKMSMCSKCYSEEKAAKDEG